MHNYRFTCGLVYYALAFNTGSLYGDVYINTFLSAALEIPAYLVAILMMNWKRLGRRWTGCSTLVCAGIASFACLPTLLLGRSSFQILDHRHHYCKAPVTTREYVSDTEHHEKPSTNGLNENVIEQKIEIKIR